ncbi:hypothetical protein WJX74_008117 [Apatococcus lobatus]|uniref:Uncharacterized protein n=1 Tax=Apatococcus lobatus TaxID=904363 RepID=A0AAW1R2D3_9CHLO
MDVESLNQQSVLTALSGFDQSDKGEISILSVDQPAKVSLQILVRFSAGVTRGWLVEIKAAAFHEVDQLLSQLLRLLKDDPKAFNGASMTVVVTQLMYPARLAEALGDLLLLGYNLPPCIVDRIRCICDTTPLVSSILNGREWQLQQRRDGLLKEASEHKLPLTFVPGYEGVDGTTSAEDDAGSPPLSRPKPKGSPESLLLVSPEAGATRSTPETESPEGSSRLMDSPEGSGKAVESPKGSSKMESPEGNGKVVESREGSGRVVLLSPDHLMDRPSVDPNASYLPREWVKLDDAAAAAVQKAEQIKKTFGPSWRAQAIMDARTVALRAAVAKRDSHLLMAPEGFGPRLYADQKQELTEEALATTACLISQLQITVRPMLC